MHQAQLRLRGLWGRQPQAPLLQATLPQAFQGGGQALGTLDLALGAERTESSESRDPRTPHLRLCQVTLTPPRAAWPPSCPRDTRVRFPWPSCGHFGPPWTEGSRWHHARVSVLLDPALQPREQRDARGTAGRRGQSLGRKKASGRNWRHSESGVNRAGPGAWLLASSDWGRYRPAPRPL